MVKKRNTASGLPSRLIALEILQSVLRELQPLDQCLASNRKLAKLSSEDRGFVRMLVATTLRRLGQIDHLWQGYLEKPLPKKATAAADIIRLGIAQLLFLKTPAHAAIHTAVEMAERTNHRGFKALINAVLRRAQNEGDIKIAEQDAALLNTPEWLMRDWIGNYGDDVAYAIASAHMQEPGLDITVKSDTEKWAERLGANILPNGSLRIKTGGMIDAKDGFGDGAWWVQDAAATIPAQLFGDLRGKTVIDLCAAPGGKTAQLAAAGAHVVAIDHNAKRLDKLSANLTRLNLSATVLCADAAHWQSATPVPYILLDAPCSATGTIRRHPDIPHLKTTNDIHRLGELQLQILENAARQLSPGGILVYAVCSLQADEGVKVIEKILMKAPRLKRLAIKPSEIPAFAELINPDGDIRTLPCDLGDLGGMDGFYVCRLQAAA